MTTVEITINTAILKHFNYFMMMYQKYFKRIFDIIAGTLLLIVLSPVIFVTMIISFICQGGKNVFFVQERVGRGCNKIYVIKFKTMTDTVDSMGNLLPDEERQTKFGIFMRDHSLDELLQLINIIKGDMSLVGPRPFMKRYVADCTEQQLRRHEVRPGVTGLAQVCGRNSISYEKRFRYDVWYVNNMCLALDIKILFMTVKAVFGIDNKKNVTDYDPLIEDRYRK